MAYPLSRSMTGDLREGMTDGTYKKVNSRERGGDVERTTQSSREDLPDVYYGFHEAQFKEFPDGSGCRPTPQYVPTHAVGDYI